MKQCDERKSGAKGITYSFAADFQHGAAELVAEATWGCLACYGVRVAGHGDEGRGAVFVEVGAADADEGRLAGVTLVVDSNVRTDVRLRGSYRREVHFNLKIEAFGLRNVVDAEVTWTVIAESAHFE